MKSQMNRNLNKSKVNIDDEWYTRYEDIEKYLINFKDELKDKVIYSPCDSENSNFVRFLKANKEFFQYKDFIHSSNDFMDPSNDSKWERADVIITNPPFSLKTPFYQWVKGNKCDLIVLLPDTLLSNTTYQNDLLNFSLHMDYTNKSFERPDGSIKQASASWFNTFKKVWTKEWKYRAGSYVMTKDWKRLYNRADNIDDTYEKPMYVPMTFIKGSNIQKFKIIGMENGVYYNTKRTFWVIEIQLKKEQLCK